MAAPDVELSHMESNINGTAQKPGTPVLEVNCMVSNNEGRPNRNNKIGQDPAFVSESTENEQSDEGPTKNGVHNPVFMEEEGTIEETQPSLTYIDFLPEKNYVDINAPPVYSEFSSMVEQANAWLKLNPEYSLWKCETVTFKVQNDFTTDQDNPLYMESAYGVNKYISGLRLWLVPQINTSLPIPEIGFTTALPGRQDDMYEHVRASTQSTIHDSIEHLNKQFQKKPLPGVILNIEMVEFKENEKSGSMIIDPNRTFWTENGSENVITIQAIRIFFILGKPEYVRIGFHDEVPDIQHTSFALSIRFGPFKDVVRKMGGWLKDKKGIRVVHLQSLNALVNMSKGGSATLDTTQCSYNERASFDTRYAKYLRVFFIYNKSEDKPYSSVNLHTRLFTPVQRDGKIFESFSKTMQRTIKWLDYTRIPPFSVETVRHQIYIGSGENMSVLDDKVDKCVRRGAGRYQLSTIRLYFPSEFMEPPPEISPETDTQAGWGCVLS